MKLPWTLVLLMALAATPIFAAMNNNTLSDLPKSELDVDKALIMERLASLDLPFEAKASEDVLLRIRQYTTAGRNDTEDILGRTVLYFPIFEHYLQLYQLPEQLKYLPMIESGLRSTARSHVGASGMWQLMGITARHWGLQVSAIKDERLDPHQSTEAAVKMLDYLYDQFEDWTLVLAAYNAGPGKVKKAIRYAGSSDFGKLKNYLPRETRRYVPAFLAAAYIANYYPEHNLEPNVPSYGGEDIRTLAVNQHVTFNAIAKHTGLSVSDLRSLNPAYLRNYIPASRKTEFLNLPADYIEPVRNLLGLNNIKDFDKTRVETVYLVSRGDTLDKIARLFNVRPEDILRWNGLQSDHVVMNQELKLYLSKAYLINRV